jgi:hypothetical protein
MAIKFEDKKNGDAEERDEKARRAKAQIEERFATPIEADAPVNPDAESELPFGKLPRAEKKARKRK